MDDARILNSIVRYKALGARASTEHLDGSAVVKECLVDSLKRTGWSAVHCQATLHKIGQTPGFISFAQRFGAAFMSKILWY